MRLLRRLPDNSFELISFDDDNTPPYAILSHTWTEGQEVTYLELLASAGKDKTGYEKICFCAERAAVDGLQYCWVDTCCIDKSTNNELNTAINSMFRCYRRASKCYAYLSDVSVPEGLDPEAFQITWIEAFRQSRWFTRGWTLQELLAPASVEFFSKEKKPLGSKISLEEEVHQTAKVPVEALRGQRLSKFSVEERLSWASTRTTTMKEDKVYCLLGIFDVFLPLIYGEGEAYATVRLKEEIQKRQKGKEIEQISKNVDSAGPNTHLRPSCVVPFRRDPDFVDRGTLLDEVLEKCSVPASRIALVGLGGVGKSQLAIEHCYRTAEHSPGTWVFWVHASNAARIKQGYQAIVDQVNLAGRNDPQADVLQLVHNWLRNEENGKWLLVLDNVDNADVLTLPASGRVSAHAEPRFLTSYIPPSKCGAVLVTSRTRTAALQLVEEDDILAIEPMDEVGAQALLQKKLGKDGDESATSGLANALEYMPLAIVQAAAYIRQRAPRCSVQQYLADFHKSDQKKTSLLEYGGGRLRRDADAKNAILLTWQISFDHIRQVRPSAADMLSLMSFFDRQGIPAELLRDRYWTESYSNDAETISPEGEGSDSGTSDSEESIDDGFEDDILMLRSYSIIALTTDGTAFDMHRLVQLATRRWLKEQGQLETWKERYIDRICAAFPKGFHKNWTQYQALYPHAKLALSQAPKSEESSKRWALLLYHAAWYALDIGNLSDAEKLSMRSLNVRKEVFGETYSDMLKSMSLVVDVLVRRGRYVEAEELGVQAVETGKRMLGDDHSSTLVSMDMLARTYESQGRWKEIEELQVQAIETKQRTLGDEHPDTLLSMSSLAFAYGKQGRLKEAEELEMQSVEAMKRVLGDEHPKTLFSMSELMSIRRIQGRWKEAEELSMQTVKINAKVFGWKHPITLLSVNMLAINLRDQNRSVEAIRLMDNVVKVGRLVLGSEHPKILFASSVLERWRREDTESKNTA